MTHAGAEASVIVQESLRQWTWAFGVVLFILYAFASGWTFGAGHSDIFARLGAVGVFVGAAAFVSNLNPYVNSKVQERLNRITEQQIQDRQFSRLVEYEMIEAHQAATSGVPRSSDIDRFRGPVQQDYKNALTLLPLMKQEHAKIETGERHMLELMQRDQRVELALVSFGTLQWAFGDWAVNLASVCGRALC